MKASNTISYVTLGKEKILEGRETVSSFRAANGYLKITIKLE